LVCIYMSCKAVARSHPLTIILPLCRAADGTIPSILNVPQFSELQTSGFIHIQNARRLAIAIRPRRNHVQDGMNNMDLGLS